MRIPHVPDDHDVLVADVVVPGEAEIGVKDVAQAEHAPLGVDDFVGIFGHVTNRVPKNYSIKSNRETREIRD